MPRIVLLVGLALVVVGAAPVPLPGPSVPLLVAGFVASAVAGPLLWFHREDRA